VAAHWLTLSTLGVQLRASAVQPKYHSGHALEEIVMKQYEVRTENLDTVLFRFPESALFAAKCTLQNISSSHPKAVLVMHELETEAEADKARLDFMESQRETDSDLDQWTFVFNSMLPVRKAIDQMRQAPKPTLTVIAPSL
jgi:hypothetical protein